MTKTFIGLQCLILSTALSLYAQRGERGAPQAPRPDNAQSLEHINFIPHPHALYEAITKIVVGKDDLPPPRKGRRAFGHWPGTPTTGNLTNEWSE